MTTSAALAIAFALLIAGLVIGLEVPICFATTALFLVFAVGFKPAALFPTGYGSITSVALLAIPMFVMSGGLMESGGIGDRLVKWVSVFVGKVRGAFWHIAIWACALFGSVCGSSVATLTCISGIVGPKLEQHKYPREWTAAFMCCAAPLGALIPPSTLMIIYAWSAGVSVLGCFLATVGPGILLAVLLSINASIVAKKHPEIEFGGAEWTGFGGFFRELGKNTVHAIPALLMPVLVLGGIYSGIMTATESAAVSVVYAAFVSVFVMRTIRFKDLGNAFLKTGKSTGAIMAMTFFMVILSNMLVKEGLPQILLNAMLSISDNKAVIMLIINVFLIFIGMIMDNTCGMMLVTPLLTPIVLSLGYSPYTFAALLCVNLGMGSITPPAAPFLYMTSEMFNVPTAKIIKPACILMLTCYLPVLIAICVWPEISLALPRLVMGAQIIG